LDIEKTVKAFSDEMAARSFFTLAFVVLPTITGQESFGGTDILFFAKPNVIADVITNTTRCIDHLQQNTTISHCPEYELTRLVVERGWTAHYIHDFKIDRDWEILRHAKVKIRQRIIRLHLRKNQFLLWLFPKTIHQIASLRLNLFGVYSIDMAVGNPGHEEIK
jgi:hypothetical protein